MLAQQLDTRHWLPAVRTAATAAASRHMPTAGPTAGHTAPDMLPVSMGSWQFDNRSRQVAAAAGSTAATAAAAGLPASGPTAGPGPTAAAAAAAVAAGMALLSAVHILPAADRTATAAVRRHCRQAAAAAAAWLVHLPVDVCTAAMLASAERLVGVAQQANPLAMAVVHLLAVAAGRAAPDRAAAAEARVPAEVAVGRQSSAGTPLDRPSAAAAAAAAAQRSLLLVFHCPEAVAVAVRTARRRRRRLVKNSAVDCAQAAAPAVAPAAVLPSPVRPLEPAATAVQGWTAAASAAAYLAAAGGRQPAPHGTAARIGCSPAPRRRDTAHVPCAAGRQPQQSSAAATQVLQSHVSCHRRHESTGCKRLADAVSLSDKHCLVAQF